MKESNFVQFLAFSVRSKYSELVCAKQWIICIACYFGKLTGAVKLKLMYAYCTCCELWDLSNGCINVCATWRKALRRVWGMPYNTHNELLPVLCNTLAVFDVMHACAVFSAHSDSVIVRYMSRYALMHGRMSSLLGRNALYCMAALWTRCQQYIQSAV